MVTNIFLYPLERAKIIMYTDMSQKVAKKRTLLRTINQIQKADGFRGLYRGYWINCLGIIPYNISLLFTYDCYREMIRKDENLSLNTKLTVLGVLSTLSSVLFNHPIDTVRRCIQADTRVYASERILTGWRNCVKHIYKEAGFLGFFRGATITMARLPP